MTKSEKTEATSRGIRDLAPAIVCLFLVVITCAVFAQTLHFDFVPYDDNEYVYNNPEITGKLSARAIERAFMHVDLGLWTPLTTISHMADCQLYGLRPAGHHLTNLLLHVANVVALFLVLRSMTGALWRSAFVAAVFAIHPLRVESVAWIAERKDVLSGLFFMLTLGAYIFYVRRKTVASYLPVAILFAMGLLAKQMLVTLPCVLLLLDYWPLNRFARGRDVMLLAEKIPLFVLSAASCIQPFITGAPEQGVVVKGVDHSLWLRIGNALVSYIVYIGKLFWPSDLTVFYPYPASIPAWRALGALALLLAISAAVFTMRKRLPALFTGWFWYLGMLVPVLGLVPLGKESHADRYTYLPEIGLCIMIAWGVAAATAKWPFRAEILGASAAIVLSLLGWLAFDQAKNWSDGVTLWQQALKHSPASPVIRNYLGYALHAAGRDDEARAEFEEAIALKPDYAEPENNLGTVLLRNGDVKDAIIHFQKALDYSPGHAEARSNLAVALIQQNRLDDAIGQLAIVIHYKPDRPDAYDDLGNALLLKGDISGAIAQFTTALDIKPDYADGHANLGNALLKKGDPRGAVAEYEKTLRIDPQDVPVLLNISRVLATCPDDKVRNGPKAVDYASQANDLTGGKDPDILDHLAAAYAEAGRFNEAVETSRRALEFATTAGDAKLVHDIQARLALYRANTPLRLPLSLPLSQPPAR